MEEPERLRAALRDLPPEPPASMRHNSLDAVLGRRPRLAPRWKVAGAALAVAVLVVAAAVVPRVVGDRTSAPPPSSGPLRPATPSECPAHPVASTATSADLDRTPVSMSLCAGEVVPGGGPDLVAPEDALTTHLDDVIGAVRSSLADPGHACAIETGLRYQIVVRDSDGTTFVVDGRMGEAPGCGAVQVGSQSGAAGAALLTTYTTALTEQRKVTSPLAPARAPTCPDLHESPGVPSTPLPYRLDDLVTGALCVYPLRLEFLTGRRRHLLTSAQLGQVTREVDDSASITHCGGPVLGLAGRTAWNDYVFVGGISCDGGVIDEILGLEPH